MSRLTGRWLEFTVFAVQACYEAGLLAAEAALDRPAVVAAVEGLLIQVESRVA